MTTSEEQVAQDGTEADPDGTTAAGQADPDGTTAGRADPDGTTAGRAALKDTGNSP
jgi:hypothetical protein